MPHEEPRRDHAEAGEQEDQDRQLEHEAETEDHVHEEAVVAIRRDHRIERGAHADEELDGEGEGHPIGEVTAGDEEEGRRENERQSGPALVLVKPGRDESPDLVEDEGGGHEERHERRHLEIEDEWIADAEECELRPLGQDLVDGLREVVRDSIAERPAAAKATAGAIKARTIRLRSSSRCSITVMRDPSTALSAAGPLGCGSATLLPPAGRLDVGAGFGVALGVGS